jgi:hypothetical protein
MSFLMSLTTPRLVHVFQFLAVLMVTIVLMAIIAEAIAEANADPKQCV